MSFPLNTKHMYTLGISLGSGGPFVAALDGFQVLPVLPKIDTVVPPFVYLSPSWDGEAEESNFLKVGAMYERM